MKDKTKEGRSLKWKVHTTNLIKEIMSNNETQTMRVPLTIFTGLIRKVAKRASELNDGKLNCLMMRLTLYEVSDPESPEYNPDLVNGYLEEYEKDEKDNRN